MARNSIKKMKQIRRSVRKRPVPRLKAKELKRSIRTRWPMGKGPNPEYPTGVHHNWGGHMFNPPRECKFAFVDADGGRWVDRGVCIIDRCEKSKECEHWQKDRNRKGPALKHYMRMKGVKVS